ncbi:MAG: hypothetical protein PF495_06920 [Spirochaetales bacterium]|jgi:hypothetical protein|nr:hypothetical protein [Spirochaetales bacterium]
MADDNENNAKPETICAGKAIRAAMHMFSADLSRGCKAFAEKAQNAETNDEVRVYNTACILFATSTIEAKVNEWISIARVCFEDEPKSFWHTLAPMVKALKLEDRWNLIASHEDGTLWDNGREPFQSFDLISTLRNELVHYKGDFLPKDSTPIKKIKSLKDMFDIKSQSTFIEDDCSTWVYDLLNSRKLGHWVASRASSFEENLLKLMNGST